MQFISDSCLRWFFPFDLYISIYGSWKACWVCGSNAFQGYFDDAKESRVKQIPMIQEPSFKNQDSRSKIQDSRIKFHESRLKNNQDQDSRLKRRLNQDKY